LLVSRIRGCATCSTATCRARPAGAARTPRPSPPTPAPCAPTGLHLHGYEDADFGHRLAAIGITGRSLRYTAPVYHLDHPRPWRNDAVIAANKALYDANRAARMTTILRMESETDPRENTDDHG
jgi:hypothetical protein